MSLLTKEDVRAAGGIVHSDGNVFFTNLDQLNAAILAKLASVELPEPVRLSTTTNRDGDPYHITGHTADQLRQAYAQGAASQLSAVPSGFLSQHNLEMLKQGYPQTIVMLKGAKRDLPLYDKQALIDLLEAAAQLAEGPMHFSNPIAADLRKLKEIL